MDTDLFALGKSFGNNNAAYEGTGSYFIDGTNGLTQYADVCMFTHPLRARTASHSGVSYIFVRAS